MAATVRVKEHSKKVFRPATLWVALLHNSSFHANCVNQGRSQDHTRIAGVGRVRRVSFLLGNFSQNDSVREGLNSNFWHLRIQGIRGRDLNTRRDSRGPLSLWISLSPSCRCLLCSFKRFFQLTLHDVDQGLYQIGVHCWDLRGSAQVRGSIAVASGLISNPGFVCSSCGGVSRQAAGENLHLKEVHSDLLSTFRKL